jgi:ABC-2 type transport system permease protein
MAFAWRANLGMLVGWASGLTIWCLASGALLPGMNDFVESDEGYRRIMATMGIDLTDLSQQFVAMMAVIVGVALAVHAAWRIGAARTEESTTRLDTILSRPVVRRRWLGGHVLLTLVQVVGLACLAGAATWVGAAGMGSDLSLGDSVAAALNTLPAVVVFGGLAVLVLGLAPRVTVAVAASAAVLSYILAFVGPALEWPDLLISVSPFRHLAAVPADDVAVLPAVVMVTIGLVSTVVGMGVFERRDLAGA